MNIHDSFPSRFLKARDLDGHAPIVVIRGVESQAMRFEGGGGKETKKLVVFFVGKDKGLVLNKTNALAIAKLLGSENTEDWRGRPIRLYGTTTKFGNDTVDCVRVRAVGEKATVVSISGRASA
jgi:hypothetical protein